MIEIFYSLLSKAGITHGRDKILHAIVGFVVGILSNVLLHGSATMVLPVLAVAIGKELYDEFKYGGFDFFDMFTTLLSGVIGIMAAGVVL